MLPVPVGRTPILAFEFGSARDGGDQVDSASGVSRPLSGAARRRLATITQP
jgi:hypothetical protein